ncbi:hypothetical protein AArcMg_0687 [Natrarchaeobaculum sulfurireducens]|uniref:Uncharacterized protein n=1 Tax=Natrarchaeobaculum sulfurireducens TaxID=2044521 RepID=A0A346PMG4_9EURY|nr:hypothetical protein AArcMg_0687 [Natrarchaeobaculum sulfurireducens]
MSRVRRAAEKTARALEITREQLSTGADRARQGGREVVDRTRETASRSVDTARDAGREVVDRGRETVDRTTDRAREVTDRGRETVDRTTDRARETVDRATDRAREAGDRAAETADRATDRAQETVDDVTDDAARGTRDMLDTARDQMTFDAGPDSPETGFSGVLATGTGKQSYRTQLSAEHDRWVAQTDDGAQAIETVLDGAGAPGAVSGFTGEAAAVTGEMVSTPGIALMADDAARWSGRALMNREPGSPGSMALTDIEQQQDTVETAASAGAAFGDYWHTHREAGETERALGGTAAGLLTLGAPVAARPARGGSRSGQTVDSPSPSGTTPAAHVEAPRSQGSQRSDLPAERPDPWEGIDFDAVRDVSRGDDTSPSASPAATDTPSPDRSTGGGGDPPLLDRIRDSGSVEAFIADESGTMQLVGRQRPGQQRGQTQTPDPGHGQGHMEPVGTRELQEGGTRDVMSQQLQDDLLAQRQDMSLGVGDIQPEVGYGTRVGDVHAGSSVDTAGGWSPAGVLSGEQRFSAVSGVDARGAGVAATGTAPVPLTGAGSEAGELLDAAQQPSVTTGETVLPRTEHTSIGMIAGGETAARDGMVPGFDVGGLMGAGVRDAVRDRDGTGALDRATPGIDTGTRTGEDTAQRTGQQQDTGIDLGFAAPGYRPPERDPSGTSRPRDGRGGRSGRGRRRRRIGIPLPGTDADGDDDPVLGVDETGFVNPVAGGLEGAALAFGVPDTGTDNDSGQVDYQTTGNMVI